MKSQLELRKEIKNRKPTFSKQDSHKKARLSKSWRRPKGIQSKMRLGIKGYARCPEIGWGSPKSVKGLSPEGLVEVKVESMKDIEGIDAKTQGAVIGGTVGKLKKIQLVKALSEKKITILNVKNPADFLKSVEEEAKEKKASKAAKEKAKEAKQKDKEKKAKEKEAEDKKAESKDGEDLADKVEKAEVKKKQEKAEKDKVITKG